MEFYFLYFLRDLGADFNSLTLLVYFSFRNYLIFVISEILNEEYTLSAHIFIVLPQSVFLRVLYLLSICLLLLTDMLSIFLSCE